jgi:hypothetical protein
MGLVVARECISTLSAPYLRQAALLILS